jgi:hypothetical protein
LEVAVEAAARDSGARHDVVDRGGGEPMPVEQESQRKIRCARNGLAPARRSLDTA